jgi:hypothetical protein
MILLTCTKYPYDKESFTLYVDYFYPLSMTILLQDYIYIYIEAPFLGSGCKAKRMVLQCINGVGSNPVEGRTKI